MPAKVIDGTAIAKAVVEKAAEEAKALPRPPCLGAILVGDDPASHTYVNAKEKRFRTAGFRSIVHRVPPDITQEHLHGLIQDFNQDPEVDGILVQAPLPPPLQMSAAIDQIHPEKDVDGFHPQNVGRLLSGADPAFLPCTPAGIMHILDVEGVELKGLNAVVAGRSNIVGKPTAVLLLERHATVTICHSRTRDLGAETRRGDVLVAAVGKPELIRGDMVKEGAVVVDVGVNRTEGGLVGDVHFASVTQVASAITPVPGGVGPLTIAMLVRNTLHSARRRLGVT